MHFLPYFQRGRDRLTEIHVCMYICVNVIVHGDIDAQWADLGLALGLTNDSATTICSSGFSPSFYQGARNFISVLG